MLLEHLLMERFLLDALHHEKQGILFQELDLYLGTGQSYKPLVPGPGFTFLWRSSMGGADWVEITMTGFIWQRAINEL